MRLTWHIMELLLHGRWAWLWKEMKGEEIDLENL